MVQVLHVKLAGSRNVNRSWELGCKKRSDGPSTEDATAQEEKSEHLIELALTTATSAGITGSLALVLGYLLHVDPLGNLHFDLQSTSVGLACFLPSFVFKSGLMAVLLTTKDAEFSSLFMPNMEKLNNRDAEDRGRRLHEIGSSPSDVQIVKESIKHYCGYRATGALSLKDLRENPVFIGLDFLCVLSQEMLFRAVLLTFASLWLSDRFYQAGSEDLFFSSGVPTIDAAKWLVGGAWISAFLIKIIRNLLKAPGKPKELTNLVKYSLDKSRSSVVTEFIKQNGDTPLVKEIVTIGVVASAINSLDALFDMVSELQLTTTHF